MNGIRRITAAAFVVFSTSLYGSDVGVISGWVDSDEGSKGIQEAVIYYYAASGEIYDSSFSRPNGWFEKSLAAGDYLVSAEKGNYIREFFPGQYSISEAKSIHVSPGQVVTVSFSLGRGGWIGGSFDIVGEDIQKGLITAVKMDQPDAGWYRSESVHGSFPQNYALTGLIPGVYKVLARATGKSTIYFPGVQDEDDAVTINVISDQGVADVSFIMEPAGSAVVTGRVYDIETGEGLAEVPVTAYQWRNFREDPNLRITSTEIDGSFRLRLTSGGYYIFARCDDCYPSSGDISIYYDNKLDPNFADLLQVSGGDVREGIDFGFDFSTTYNLVISGNVLDGLTGEGLGGVLVEAVDSHSGQTVNSAYSIGSGDFIIDNLSSGTYLISFSQMNVIPYFYRESQVWQNAETIELTADFRGVQTDAITQDYGNLGLSIAGLVTVRSEPVGNARVYAYPLGEDYPVAFARTNAAGDYAIIQGLVPGSYTVVCDLFGYNYEVYPETIELDLLHHPSARNIDFDLVEPTTEVTEQARRPEIIEIRGNYPNPFNAGTVVEIYSGSTESQESELLVYDILGRNVGAKNIIINPGLNRIVWSFEDFSFKVSSGIYFYRVGDLNRTFRMVLLK